MFQRHNDPKLTSKMTNKFLFHKKVNVLFWPTMSPNRTSVGCFKKEG